MSAVPGVVVQEAPSVPEAEIEQAVRAVGLRARAAALELARSTAEQRSRALLAAAAAIRAATTGIAEANRADMAAAVDKGLSGAIHR